MKQKEFEEILQNYHWMLNTVKVMRETSGDVKNGVAQYGIDAAMPKGKGTTGDVVFNEVVRRSRNWERIAEYERKIYDIQKRIDSITEDREAEVLHWLLEGKSMRWIGRHMELSHTNIQKIKSDIVRKMTELPKLPLVP